MKPFMPTSGLRFSHLALLTTACFVLHAMLYFWNRFEVGVCVFVCVSECVYVCTHAGVRGRTVPILRNRLEPTGTAWNRLEPRNRAVCTSTTPPPPPPPPDRHPRRVCRSQRYRRASLRACDLVRGPSSQLDRPQTSSCMGHPRPTGAPTHLAYLLLRRRLPPPSTSTRQARRLRSATTAPLR